MPHVLVVEGLAKFDRQTERRLRRGEIAILRVRRGRARDDAPHDTTGAVVGTELPADAAPREVQLVCRLLGEIVHLRRRAHRNARRQRRLAVLADTDPLTGLLNRRGWQGALHALRRRHATIASHCLLILDLDHFKRINDSSGYATGDAVLARVGVTLRHAVRAGDVVARLGGDEFGVLLANVEPAATTIIVERLRSSISSLAGPASDPLAASAGYVCFTAGPGFAEQAIMAAADSALRQAKLAGRDRAVAATRSG